MAPSRSFLRLSLLSALVLASACKKQEETKPGAAPSANAPAAAAPKPKTLKVGLVTDVGGRGDHSFNDSALRGLELWGAGKKMEGGSYKDATPEELKETLAQDLATRGIAPVGISPVVLQSKVPEDYEPNLQTLVDEGVSLAVGVGFMLENAVETVAKRNPDAKFLLIDSPLVSADGKVYTLPNVRTVMYREEQGSFLVGALAGLASKNNKVGFVGGMEVPLIKKFEAGFRAGVAAVNPKATVLVNYTGSFDNVSAGKQVGQDLVNKGADIVYHAAGSDGLGVIQAVKEARAAGKPVFAIGVDSDQSHLAPEAVLTSMLKRVDLGVYEAVRDLSQGKLEGGDVMLGLKEGGVTYAPVRVEFPGKAEALQKVEELRAKIVSGELQVPSHPSQLTAAPAKP
ncbi:nucleoside-binding protein [Archangium gephyra]|uniref:Nucleoside-binding protein n=1 Tax=Archangium gephyra TaxID=48 RepID=A0AAC8TJ50_9BACT|nr:BMP family ABC transporter substrate-binding protein [Archangium gephyra]AKJ07545.1 Nucleoside ABC transporter, periplasmic nucleoside-binding protein [Archangium gephyra]REG19058.1 nucleoside-binding protein [Archangium gephyra]